MSGEAGEYRRLGAWLAFGVLVMPMVFFWFLLRRGYSLQVRLGALAYLALTLASGLVRVVGL